MAEIKVYSSENFHRTKLWYIAFSSVFILIFAVSIFYKNIVGAILMFFLLGGYLYYGIINNKEIDIKTTDEGLIVDNKKTNWNHFSGYSLEIDPIEQKIKNIVFVYQKSHNIHTINDTDTNIKDFLEELNRFLPIVGEFPQTFRERVSRKMKL